MRRLGARITQAARLRALGSAQRFTEVPSCCTAQQLTEALQIDVASAEDHPDPLAGQWQAAHGGRCSAQATGWLDDDLHALGEKAHGLDQLRIGHGHDVIDIAAHDGKGQLAHRLCLCAIGNRVRCGDAHDGAAAHRLLGVIACLRFDTDHLASGRQCTRGQGTAADQATTADADKQGVERTYLLKQLLGCSSLAGNHVRVVERRDQCHAALARQCGGKLFAVLREAVEQHHLGTITARGSNLGLGCVGRHQNHGLDTLQSRRQSDRLGMVATGECQRTRLALGRIKARQRIEATAELERTHALEVFTFEMELGAKALVKRARAQHRRLVGMAFDTAGGGNNVIVSGQVCHGAGVFHVSGRCSIYWLVLELLKTFSWQELRHHPWRNAAAVAAVMLGVALALSVSLINQSALQEFTQAVRSVNGQADLEVRAATTHFDEGIYRLVANDAQVLTASPVLESRVQVTRGTAERPMPLRVVGVDALLIARVAPDLMPLPGAGAPRLAMFAPNAVFLNPSAWRELGLAPTVDAQMTVQSSAGAHQLQISGNVGASGTPLAVMDIGAAQDLLGLTGKLSRIDLRLQAGLDPVAVAARLRADPRWPTGVRVQPAVDAAGSISNLSRAYRVNLTVLALVALFTGAFLVFSVLALSVRKRAQQFALLGVLGLPARDRLRLVLAESLVLGLVGSLLGVLLGTALAWLALRWLGGDLGGGYFKGVAPHLQWSASAALGYGFLGVLAAIVGAWVPAASAARLPPAATLKGVGLPARGHDHPWLALGLLLVSVLLALAPPLWGMALAAYLAIALLLIGGISALPSSIALLYDRLAPVVGHRLLPMLAIERARRVRGSAAVAISGVVASLSLAVALTVMVASFRHSVQDWLDVVLPADLYLRQGAGADSPGFATDLVDAISALTGVRRVAPSRSQNLNLVSGQPAVALLARPLGDPARSLALVGALQTPPPGTVPIYVSEPMSALYGLKVGASYGALAQALTAATHATGQTLGPFFVAGVWRDYARQFGAIAIDLDDYVRLTGDRQVNDLALWLKPGTDTGALQREVNALIERLQGPMPVEIASTSELRATSLRIFDRSFAVTYWLQAVAIAIGLFGVAANFSAQVLARRKEFGLLVHLGLTQRQLLTLVALEGLAWTAIGALAGLLLGLGVSVILVHVVNPQSFHWSMDLLLPWPQLTALCAATVLAGTATAWLGARAAARHDVVLAVKEDW